MEYTLSQDRYYKTFSYIYYSILSTSINFTLIYIFHPFLDIFVRETGPINTIWATIQNGKGLTLSSWLSGFPRCRGRYFWIFDVFGARTKVFRLWMERRSTLKLKGHSKSQSSSKSKPTSRSHSKSPNPRYEISQTTTNAPRTLPLSESPEVQSLIHNLEEISISEENLFNWTY